MAVDFRCEKCGKPLSAEAQSGGVRCPHCQAMVTVPQGLASLPQPHAPPAPPVAMPIEELAQAHIAAGGAVLVAMAAGMPWVISLLCHLGVFGILSFAYVWASDAPTNTEDIIFPDARLSADPGGRLNPGSGDPNLQAQQNVTQTTDKQWSKREGDVSLGADGSMDKPLELIGVGGGGAPSGGELAVFGLTAGGSGAGPRSNFFGSGGNAYNIVYVVDRSGSMLDSMDLVRRELLRSVSELADTQSFHIVFLGEGTPLENPPRRLVPATRENKLEAAQYLKTIQAQGSTQSIPALRRAFEVLDNADKSKKGKLIYVLSDGEFKDNYDKRVLTLMAELNKSKDVLVNTVLYQYKAPVAEEFFKTLAQQNGGIYKYVGLDE